MANTTSQPDDSTTFMRLPNEPVKAWNGFMCYRDLGPERTLNKVLIAFGKPPSYMRQLQYWSSDYEWVKRARAFDHYTESIQLKQSVSEVPLWEKRRLEALEKNLEMAAKLWAKVELMLEHPITHEVKDDYRGVIEVHPAKWSYSSLAQVVKTAAELQAATISEALPSVSEEDFDVDTATIDQLREYVARHKRGGK